MSDASDTRFTPMRPLVGIFRETAFTDEASRPCGFTSLGVPGGKPTLSGIFPSTPFLVAAPPARSAFERARLHDTCGTHESPLHEEGVDGVAHRIPDTACGQIRGRFLLVPPPAVVSASP